MWSAKGAPATLVGVASVATAGAAAGEASYRVRPTARLYKTGARRAGRGALSHGALCAVALSAAAPPAARRVRGGRAGRERDRELTARATHAVEGRQGWTYWYAHRTRTQNLNPKL